VCSAESLRALYSLLSKLLLPLQCLLHSLQRLSASLLALPHPAVSAHFVGSAAPSERLLPLLLRSRSAPSPSQHLLPASQSALSKRLLPLLLCSWSTPSECSLPPQRLLPAPPASSASQSVASERLLPLLLRSRSADSNYSLPPQRSLHSPSSSLLLPLLQPHHHLSPLLSPTSPLYGAALLHRSFVL